MSSLHCACGLAPICDLDVLATRFHLTFPHKADVSDILLFCRDSAYWFCERQLQCDALGNTFIVRNLSSPSRLLVSNGLVGPISHDENNDMFTETKQYFSLLRDVVFVHLNIIIFQDFCQRVCLLLDHNTQQQWRGFTNDNGSKILIGCCSPQFL